MEKIDEDVIILLNKWLRRVKRTQLAHRFSAKSAQTNHIKVGIPAIILSSIVSTSVFASFQVTIPSGKIIVGLISMVATILTALQTFLRFDETSRDHQKADVGYGEIRQSIEHKLVFPLSHDSMEEFCNLIKEQIAKLSDESPLIHEKMWKKAKLHVENETIIQNKNLGHDDINCIFHVLEN